MTITEPTGHPESHGPTGHGDDTETSAHATARGHGPAALSASLLSALDPALLDLAELTLTADTHPHTVTLDLAGDEPRIHIRPSAWASLATPMSEDGATAATRPAPHAHQQEWPMSSDCLTCSLRDALLDHLLDAERRGLTGHLTYLLPVGVELPHLCPGLADALDDLPTRVRLAGIAHLLAAADATRTLLTHTPLAEMAATTTDPRLALLREDEDRCAAEVHLTNMAYADVTVLVDPEDSDPAATSEERALVEHLLPGDALLVPGLSHPLGDILHALTHEADVAHARAHPATMEASGGGTDSSAAWTLDLSSARPFHPGRLREMAARLAGDGCVVRGCFWLPSRPTEVLVWESVDGVTAVGRGGTWADMPEGEARCHLIVTGVGEPERQELFVDAFTSVLLGEDEMAHSLEWIGADDGLGDWLGDPD